MLYTFGRVDDPAVVERLRKRAHSILRRCSSEQIVAAMSDWRLIDALRYGPVLVLEALWKQVRIDAIVADLTRRREVRFPVERALFAMVANRALAPSSKLYCYEQWLREDVRIQRTDHLEPQRLDRALDFLGAHASAIEAASYFRLADLFRLDGDVMFCDTKSRHFETDEADLGVGEDHVARGSQAAGGERCRARRKRGYSKNGRPDPPQSVVGRAVSRDGLPVRDWVFPEDTVDLTTVKQVNEGLRGWKLERCVFVGTSGMVSEDNSSALSGGGAEYLLRMPLRRGGEVAEHVSTRPGRYRETADNLHVKEVRVGDGARRRR